MAIRRGTGHAAQGLVLDEPPPPAWTPKGRDSILSQIKEYHQENGTTVLLVSHSMEDVAPVRLKRPWVMNNAKVFLHDDVEKVFPTLPEMEAMGLSIPQVSRIFLDLAGRGYPVTPNVFTVEGAKQEILRVLGKGSAHA